MQYNGRGILEQPDHTRYDGEFLNGMKHGNGLTTYLNGDQYDGQWANDQ